MILPLLFLLFSSLYTSHAPILVLKKIARAIRVSLHSWVSELFRREGGTTKDAAGKAVLYSRTGPVWRMGEILTLAGCITGLSVWFSVSDQPSPAVGESQNSQNAMLPTPIWVCQMRAGGIQLSVTMLAQIMLQSDQYWQTARLTRGQALMSASGDRLRCEASMYVTTLN